jgi:Domain of unknown function (DUF397)
MSPPYPREPRYMQLCGANEPEPKNWRRASFCTAGECVEVGRQDDLIVLRDSKDPRGGILRFTADEFRAFALGVQAGEFEDFCAP